MGDYYLRQRYYDSNSGLFLRRDTYEGRQSEPLTLHKYVYTHNNPVNAIDPSGLSTFLTWNQLKEIGNQIHEEISEDFVSYNPTQRRADFRRQGEGLTVLRILREADGLAQGNPNFGANRRQPDLADYSVRQIYEIKSRSRYAEAYLQLSINLAALNRAPGQTHTWEEGDTATYVYSGGPIVLPYGKIATVNPAVSGVITYNLLDDPHTASNMSASVTMSAIALLVVLMIAAAARNSSAPGAAGLA